jgi:hypothetical protein
MPADRDPAVHLRHAFVRDGHLTSLPSRRPMVEAACAFLAERFEPDRLYDEAEVNAILADDAPDVATLRRLLVDHGYLGRRNGGAYWRERPTPPAERLGS